MIHMCDISTAGDALAGGPSAAPDGPADAPEDVLEAFAAMQIPAPVISGKPEEVADGVFVLASDGNPLNPNIGIVLGRRAALVVDTGFGPRNGATVLEAARTLAGDRRLYVTPTHFHPEHAFGTQAFASAATIILNRSQHEEQNEKAAQYAAMFAAFGEGIAEQLRGYEPATPDVVFDGSASIDLGGRRVELTVLGSAHTRGDLVVSVPDAEVLFTGDLAEQGMFPGGAPDDPDIDGDRWIAGLDALLRDPPAIVVPGHGEVGDAGIVSGVCDYLVQVRDLTRALRDQGHDLPTITAEAAPRLRARHPEWIAEMMIPTAIGFFVGGS